MHTEYPKVIEPAKPNLSDLQRELHHEVADEWENIGIQLDIKDGVLRRIKCDNGGDCRACLREMFREWLNSIAPTPTWSAMANALDVLRYDTIATRLRNLYL